MEVTIRGIEMNVSHLYKYTCLFILILFFSGSINGYGIQPRTWIFELTCGTIARVRPVCVGCPEKDKEKFDAELHRILSAK